MEEGRHCPIFVYIWDARHISLGCIQGDSVGFLCELTDLTISFLRQRRPATRPTAWTFGPFLSRVLILLFLEYTVYDCCAYLNTLTVCENDKQ